MQGKLWGAKGREKLTHGSQMLSFGFLHPVLPLQQSHWLNLTELQPQEQQRLSPFIKPLGGLEPTLRVWYSGLNTNLNVASPLLFLSTIQLFFHDLLQAYFWGKGGCFLFLNNTAHCSLFDSFAKQFWDKFHAAMPIAGIIYFKSNDCYTWQERY